MGLVNWSQNYFAGIIARSQIMIADEKANRAASSSASSTAVGRELPRRENPNALALAERNDANIAIAMRITIAAIQSLPFMLKERVVDSDGVHYEDASDHPVAQLIDEPNPHHTWEDILSHYIQTYVLGGNSYFALERTDRFNPVGEIWPLEFGLTKLRSDHRGYPNGFLHGPFGKQIAYELSEMLYIRNYNVNTPFYGLSIITPILRQIRSDYHAEAYNESFFKNGARPSAIFTPKDGMDPQQAERMKAAINANHGRVEDSHGMFISPVDGVYTPTTPSMTDMQFTEGLRLNREKEFGLLGLPPFLGGVLEFANYANALIQEGAFWRHTIKPYVRVFCRAFTRQICRTHYRDDNLELQPDYSGVDALQKDEVKKATGFSILVKADIMTRDEARQRGYGLEPHEDGRGSEPLAMGPSLPDPAATGGDTVAYAGGAKGLSPEDKKMAYWRAFDVKALIGEDRLKHGIAKHFRGQSARVLRAIREITENGKLLSLIYLYTKADLDSDAMRMLFDKTKENAYLLETITPIFIELVDKYGEAALTELGIGVAFNANDPSVRSFIGVLENKITSINDTSFKYVQNILKRNYESGAGIETVVRELKDKFRFLTTTHARTIARTESTKILNGSAHAAWEQGGVTHTEWLSTRDSLTRDLHADDYPYGRNGEIRKMGDPFVGGGGTPILFPGDPGGDPEDVINCRCTTMPIINDDPGADLNKGRIPEHDLVAHYEAVFRASGIDYIHDNGHRRRATLVNL